MLRAEGNLRHLWLRPAEQVLSQGRVATRRDALLRRVAARDHEVRHRLSRRQHSVDRQEQRSGTGHHADRPGAGAPGTKELKELSLAIKTSEGLVLVVGCSHPGIEAIVAEAVKIDPHIHFIAGGFHLVVAQDPAIEKSPPRCSTPTRSITSPPATAPASRPSPRCKRRSATATSTPDWERLWVWVRTRAPNRIEPLPMRWTKAICTAIACCSPRATT